MSLSVPETDLLEALSADVLGTLEAVGVAAYIVDCHRRVRWQNAASIELVGDLRGRLDVSVGLNAEDLERAREAFARKLNGAPHAEPASYAKKFSGKYEHRLIAGGVGHNLPQEAPQAFAQAVIDVNHF